MALATSNVTISFFNVKCSLNLLSMCNVATIFYLCWMLPQSVINIECCYNLLSLWNFSIFLSMCNVATIFYQCGMVPQFFYLCGMFPQHSIYVECCHDLLSTWNVTSNFYLCGILPYILSVWNLAKCLSKSKKSTVRWPFIPDFLGQSRKQDLCPGLILVILLPRT